MSDKRFHGIIAPITTPFSESGEILWSELEKNLDRYLQSPLSGYLVLGSTGEAIHLDVEERLELVSRTRAIIPGGKAFLAGVSFPALKGCLSFLDELADYDIAAVLVSVPHYYKNQMTESSLGRFFSAVADHSKFPLLLYNFPQCTGLELPLTVIWELSQHPNVIGMKESSGNIRYFQGAMERTRAEDFQMLGGSAEILVPSLSLGLEAGIYAIACVFPELVSDVMDAFKTAPERSRGLQRKLYRASTTIVAKLGVPAIKYAMDLKGMAGRLPRRPLEPLSPEGKLEVEAMVTELEGALDAG